MGTQLDEFNKPMRYGVRDIPEEWPYFTTYVWNQLMLGGDGAKRGDRDFT